MKDSIFIANPGYGVGTQNLPAQLAAYRGGNDARTCHHFEITGSLLTWCFNTAWATALNLKETVGLTHFLLWHADVRPVGQDWLDVLLSEMKASGADVLSAIIPIKDSRGLTSTARDSDPWQPIRVTQHEAQRILPQTWTSDDVLLNTGLMLVDFTKDWVYKVKFTMQDQIVRRPDGKWTALIEPEDWNFSRQCHRFGLKLVATRAVVVEHFGQGCWRSDAAWGAEIDTQNVPLPEPIIPDEPGVRRLELVASNG